MRTDEQRALLVAFLEQYDPTRDGSNEDAIDAFLASRSGLPPALGMSPYAPPDPTAPAPESPKKCKMKPLTDDEATKVLLAERNYYREPELIWLALTHALAAIEDRAALVKIADRGWPGGAELDAARRHMRGKK